MKPVKFGKIEWCLLGSIGLIVFLCMPPTHSSRDAGPVADIYNSHTKLHAGILIKIEAAHDFPNGTTEEGWLIRGEHGPDVWFPASRVKRAIVEKR